MANYEKPEFCLFIIVIFDEHLNLIKRNRLYGTPDIVIEVRSSSTAKYDQEKKKAIYERYGVKEYWIVAPLQKRWMGIRLVMAFSFRKHKQKVV